LVELSVRQFTFTPSLQSTFKMIFCIDDVRIFTTSKLITVILASRVTFVVHLPPPKTYPQ
jgi:hypothetical protein